MVKNGGYTLEQLMKKFPGCSERKVLELIDRSLDLLFVRVDGITYYLPSCVEFLKKNRSRIKIKVKSKSERLREMENLVKVVQRSREIIRNRQGQRKHHEDKIMIAEKRIRELCKSLKLG